MRFVYRLKQLMLMGGDFLAFIWGFYFAVTLRYYELPDWSKLGQHLTPFFILFFFWVVILFINGVYDLGQLRQKTYSRRFLESALISLIFGVVFFYIFTYKNISPKTVLLLNVILGFSLSYLWRLFFNHYINTRTFQANTIFVGFTQETQELINLLQNYPERGYKISAIIDPEGKIHDHEYPFSTVYHDLSELEKIVSQHKGELIIIAPQLKKDIQALQILYKFLFSKIKITDLTSFYEIITGRIPPSTFSEAWFLDNIRNHEQIIYEKTRTAIDFFFGLILFLFFILSLIIIIPLIKLSSPGPIFFKQKRVGKWNKEFTIYKFRSMFALSPDGSAEIGEYSFDSWIAKKDDKRITRVGKFLRQTRLDELPQCINLLKGDITIIGPRPQKPEIVIEMIEKMPYYSLRHLIKPGLTGWAVIHQNPTDTIEATLQKLQYDLYYIKNRSLLLDIVILLRTINVIFRMKGQ